MPDIGVVDAAAVARSAPSAPAARAAGVAEDVRATSPRLAYEGFEPALLRRPAGDVQARLEQRALELLPCLDLLDRLLASAAPPRRRRSHAGGEVALGIGRVESPRGATVVRRRARRRPVGPRPAPHRLVRELARRRHAAATNLLPDFPLINKSFELCYACVDR